MINYANSIKTLRELKLNKELDDINENYDNLNEDNAEYI